MLFDPGLCIPCIGSVPRRPRPVDGSLLPRRRRPGAARHWSTTPSSGRTARSRRALRCWRTRSGESPRRSARSSVIDGVYALRGWGHRLAASPSRHPTAGSSSTPATPPAPRPRCARCSSRRLASKIKVAAILLTHWHYADGTGAWLDDGTEDLGTRVPRPQPQHVDRHQRDERHLPGACDRAVRRLPPDGAVRTRFRTSWASRPRSCWPSPATRHPTKLFDERPESSTSSSLASRCRSLPTARTRPTASASTFRASACS